MKQAHDICVEVELSANCQPATRSGNRPWMSSRGRPHSSCLLGTNRDTVRHDQATRES